MWMKFKKKFPLWWAELLVVGVLIIVFIFMFQLERSKQIGYIRDYEESFTTSLRSYNEEFQDNVTMTEEELYKVMWNTLNVNPGSTYSGGKFYNNHTSVAIKFFDAEGNTVLSSWDRNLLLEGYYYPVAEDGEVYQDPEHIYFCLEDWFGANDIDDFLKTTKDTWNVSYVLGWYDDVEGFIPVEIRFETWDWQENQDSYVLVNEALKAPIPEEYLVCLVNNNSQYPPLEDPPYVGCDWWFDMNNVIDHQNDAAFENIDAIYAMDNENDRKIICNAKGFGSGGSSFQGIDSCYNIVGGAGVYGIATMIFSPAKMALTSGALWSRMACMMILLQGGAIVGFFMRRKMKEKQLQVEHMRNTFINAMAHEMKTPAAVIKNGTECIKENIHPEKNDHYLDMISNEAERMNELLGQMLLYTRTSDGVYELKKENMSLVELVNAVCKSYQIMIEKKGMKLHIKEDGPGEVVGDSSLLKMVIDNYISNAVKYGVENGKIVVRIGDTSCSVYNQGRGLTAEERKKIWDPLYVADSSRTKTDGSSGMGLAISKNILELHGAEYGVENVDGGVRFYFRL